jgi:DNA-binding response OmpR family regulator
MTETPSPPPWGQGAAEAAPSFVTDTDRLAGGSAPGRLHILVVEDHPDILRYLVLLLEGAGHRVRAATNLAGAVDAAATEPVDLLLSDIGLPDGSGHDLLRRLRDARPGLPAIAFSGFGSDDDVRDSLDAGFADHLVKPLDFRRLTTAIRNALAE